MTGSNNIRQLLSKVGIGHWNATMMIPTMMIAPATTDPKSAQTILVVQALQKILWGMGATDVALSGRLDEPTGRALARVVGPNWERTTWSGNIAAVVAARDSGMSLRTDAPEVGAPMAVGGPLDFLPDVPGGTLTYAIGAYLLYKHLTRDKRRS